MCRKFKLALTWVVYVLLVFLGAVLFRGVFAATLSSPLVLEDSREWYTVGNTVVWSICASDVDGDDVEEIITGGAFKNGSYDYGQLRIWAWNGYDLILETSHEWLTTASTYVWSVCASDVDGDGVKEIIAGGYHWAPEYSQLTIWNWNGSTLTLETSYEWITGSSSHIYSVFAEDVDADGVEEIMTVGPIFDGSRWNAQLRILSWNGSTMTLEKSQEWYTFTMSYVYSVYADDVDNDGVKEIITGGYAHDGTRWNGQIRVWNWDGSTLTLETSKEWYTIGTTYLYSVFAEDVDGDGLREIITGGIANDGTRENAQLRIWSWDGSTLTLETSQEWCTVESTYVYSVFVDDADGDGVKEITAGGYHYDGTRNYGELKVWSWDGSALALETSREWYTMNSASVISVFVHDVNGDGIEETMTGGTSYDGTRNHGQLRVWAFPLVDSLNVSVDGGPTHFRGEMAEFYVLTFYRGTPLNVTQINLTLYRPDGIKISLESEYVAKGLYKASYNIPSDAPTGTYTLTVEACYTTNAKDLKGAALKSFALSPTLTQWNAWLLTIQEDMATVKTDVGLIKFNLTAINADITVISGSIATIETGIGTIKANVATINANITAISGSIAIINTDIGLIETDVAAINARITSINGTIATIETDIGTIETNLTAINAKITSIDGNIVTIETDLGTIRTDINIIDAESIPSIVDTQGSQGNILYVITTISVLAATGALGTLALVLRKR